MRNRRSKKSGDGEWSRRAQAILGRRKTASSTQAEASAKTEALAKIAKPIRKTTQRIRDRAREEWMKWAQVLVDHIVASEAAADLSMPAGASSLPLQPNPPTGLGPEKPSREEWIKWAEVSIERLTTCVHVYSKPPYDDAFMSDRERQEKNTATIGLLKRIHALTDDADTPTDSLLELEHHDERAIAGLKMVLAEVLARLPQLSADMQRLLKSPWFDNCNGRLADELFRGPLGGHEPEGIGSGYPDHGRLPESLKNLLEREELGEGRHARAALRAPHAHHLPRWHDDVHRRRVDTNNHLIRTAGRVE